MNNVWPYLVIFGCFAFATIYSIGIRHEHVLQEKYRKKHQEGNQMTLEGIVNSKFLAMLMGAWITYCAGVGDFGGAVFLLFFYSLMLWDLNAKKATGSDTSDGNK